MEIRSDNCSEYIGDLFQLGSQTMPRAAQSPVYTWVVCLSASPGSLIKLRHLSLQHIKAVMQKRTSSRQKSRTWWKSCLKACLQKKKYVTHTLIFMDVDCLSMENTLAKKHGKEMALSRILWKYAWKWKCKCAECQLRTGDEKYLRSPVRAEEVAALLGAAARFEFSVRSWKASQTGSNERIWLKMRLAAAFHTSCRGWGRLFANSARRESWLCI